MADLDVHFGLAVFAVKHAGLAQLVERYLAKV